MKNLERQLKLVADDYPFTVAIASDDKKHVNQHFGTTRCFLIYGFNEQQVTLLEALQYQHVSQGHDQGRLQARIQALEPCAAVFSVACGASAMLQLKQAGIHSEMVEPNTDIHLLLQDLHQQYLRSPATWMQQSSNNLDHLEHLLDESWD